MTANIDPFDKMPNVKFAGPAQTEFSTLHKQACYFLNEYWPKWNNYEKPESYMLPPVFYFINPKISDETVDTLEDSLNPVRAHRTADNAEYIMYNAINQLIEDQQEYQGPFIAV